MSKYYSGDHVKKNGMGRLCGTYGGTRISYSVLVGNLRERDNLEGLGVDESILLKLTLNKSVLRVGIGLLWLRMGLSGGFL
jgi:hypothetical protein